jgi:hypothetical protein
LVLAAVAASVTVLPASPVAADGNEAPGAPLSIRAITGGYQFTCALLDDGSVLCWGGNSSAELGRGDNQQIGGASAPMGRAVPVDLGPGQRATAISSGRFHTCALLENGAVKCWGHNGTGQLGLGDTGARGDQADEMGDNLPTVDLGTDRTAIAITAGGHQTCAILDDHSVKCWGKNETGQLGLGDTTNRGDDPNEMGDNLPTVDLGPGRTAVAIATGGTTGIDPISFHTCAVLDDGSLKCWGDNQSGQLGDGDTINRGDDPGEMGAALPAVDLGSGRTATAVAVAFDDTCALLDDGHVKCWGANGNGQLGQGDTSARGDGPGELGDALAAVNLGVGRTATAISIGHDYGGGAYRAHACALLDDHSVKCWGSGARGELGQDTNATRGDGAGEMGAALPAVNLHDRPAVAVTTGSVHSCAALGGGELECWGYNDTGQLGQNSNLPLGDQAGEMAGLSPIFLGFGRTVARPPVGVAVTVTADQASVVAGQAVDYDISVTNTGSRDLSEVTVDAPDVADCDADVGDLAPGETSSYPCSHPTTDDDVPTMVNQVLVTSHEGAYALSNSRRTRVDPVVTRPDAQIRLGGGAFIGNGVYNTTGAGQTRSTTVPRLGTATFTVRIQNDGNVADDLRVRGQATTSRYTVTYKAGSTNVTSQVVAGTYTLDDVGPGATRNLTVIVKARAGTPVGNLVNRLVTVTSVGDTTRKDAVKATVRRR